MDQFEYVMVLVSIIVALAIAHLLTAIADSIHRLRGNGERLKIDAVYVLWASYVLIYLVTFWWWEFKFQETVVDWSLGLYLFVVTYAAMLFMLATILVPHRMQGVMNSYDYFMRGRKWFFGTLILLIGIDWVDSFLKSYEWGMQPALLIQYGIQLSTYIVGMLSERRSIQLGAAFVAFASQLVYLFQGISLLGSW